MWAIGKMEHQYRGIITEKEEFLYPDSILETLQKELHIGMPLDGKPGIQLLLETASEEIVMQLEGEEFQAEWYQMVKFRSNTILEMGKTRVEQWF